MSLYPTLEDLAVDSLAKEHVMAVQEAANGQEKTTGAISSLYSGLGLEEFLDYGGLDISAASLTQHMPSEVALALRQSSQPLAQITPSHDKGVAAAAIKQGVRMVQLAKDQDGKLGVAVSAIDKGLFVSFVWKGSAASMGGLRFGDQILQIDGKSVAGWSMKEALKVLKKADPARVVFAVRDRPFERTITVVKDATNHIGFMFKQGEINAIVKDSSAARNGLLIHHNIIEINGQNVVGIHDLDLQRMFKEAPRSVTLTVMPAFIFQHLIKKIGFKKIKSFMDHSIPEM